MTHDADRTDIIELFGRYADIADTKNFDELPRLVHTDPFTMDFQSVTGMPPVRTGLDDYREGLRGSFDAFIATHHIITGHVITIKGDHAHAHAHVRAEHWVPDHIAGNGPNRWLVVGFYENEVTRTEQGWRFNKVALTATYQENTHLLAARSEG